MPSRPPRHRLLALLALCAALAVARASDAADAADPFSPHYDALAHAHDLTAEAILRTHDILSVSGEDAVASRRHPALQVLGFVTPWNGGGAPRAAAEARRGRLDIASPVLYRAAPPSDDHEAGSIEAAGSMEATGLTHNPHDFDEMVRVQDLKESGARIEPRVEFVAHAWSASDLRKLQKDSEDEEHAPSDQHTHTLAGAIRTECAAHGYTGVVLEGWGAALASGPFVGVPALCALSRALRKTGLYTTLVLPPYKAAHAPHAVTPQRLREVAESFSHVVVMTYDHTSPGAQPGPLAPLPWVRAVARFLAHEAHLAPKLFLGVPMYGLQFAQRGPGADAQQRQDRHVTGADVLALLRDEPGARVRWDADAAEHFVQAARSVSYVPSRASVAARAKLASELGCAGVALWEVGQGLDHLFEEL